MRWISHQFAVETECSQQPERPQNPRNIYITLHSILCYPRTKLYKHARGYNHPAKHAPRSSIPPTYRERCPCYIIGLPSSISHPTLVNLPSYGFPFSSENKTLSLLKMTTPKVLQPTRLQVQKSKNQGRLGCWAYWSHTQFHQRRGVGVE